jgi:hypothetical protein
MLTTKTIDEVAAIAELKRELRAGQKYILKRKR